MQKVVPINACGSPFIYISEKFLFYSLTKRTYLFYAAHYLPMRVEYVVVSIIIVLVVLLIMMTIGSTILPTFINAFKGFGGLIGK